MAGQVSTQLLPLPAVTNPSVTTPGYGNTTGAPMQGFVYDATGQLQPPGAKPRVTATLWEDEGSLCYQVEAKGICVARREDNHMINGTKLLNVAGMTRGRRDGILKSEKLRHVVKIGPMHLKGVWIPYERALEFANKEKITDLLYPLFVHNIGTLLYHPTNRPQAEMIVQESQQRRLENPHARAPQDSQPPALHHHHSMQAQVPSHLAQTPHSRPGMERAHTFPTPPTSTSSLMSITGQGSPYEWGSQSMNSGIQNPQSLSMDGALTNARSLPATPATSPPGSNLQAMPAYQGQSSYETSKPYYSAAPASHSQYAPQQPLAQSGMAPYSQSLSGGAYMKNEMGANPGRTSGGQPDAETADAKSDRYPQTNGHVATGSGEPVSEQEQEYMQDPAYQAHRGSYTYGTNPSVGTLAGETAQIASDIAGSPPQQSTSARMSAHANGGAHAQWPSDYATPPRTATSSLYNAVSDTRGTASNGSSADTYSVTSNSTPTYSTGINSSLGTKRMREDNDVDRSVRPASRGTDFEHKRRKTITDSTMGGPVGGGAPLALQPMVAGGIVSRQS
ncbi:hypothetical protein MPDQ_007363 [Monascus purpureus]|uniref:Cell pattern formation-associated protein STUA n=1 Tax=Monascus purpureus TaxID=5098 RepID=A0A507QW18_MONPU|nr:hypothetical protein MPDQ_007363 [Monascus purpureus]